MNAASLALLILWASSVSSQIGPSTTYDGVVPTVFNNSYVFFNGRDGVSYQDQSAPQLTSYQMSLWFKPQNTTAQQSGNLNLISIKDTTTNNGLKCQLQKTGNTLTCLSQMSGSMSLSVSSSSIRAQNWYILLVRVNGPSSSVLELRQSNFDSLVGTQQIASFFPGGQSQTSISMKMMTIGIDQDLRNGGFIGSIRNVRVLSSNPSDSKTKAMQFTYLTSSASIMPVISINLLTPKDYINVMPSTGGSTVVGNLKQLYDQSSAFSCWLPRTDSILSTIDPNGDVPSSNNYDGVACIDHAEKLFFSSSSSNAVLPVRPQSVLTSFTLEFWFLAPSVQSGQAFLVSLGSSSSKLPQLALKQEQNSSMMCYPFLQSSTLQGINYFDYSNQNLLWTHISCTVDLSIPETRGSLYFGTQEFNYYQGIQPYRYPSFGSGLKIFLNGDLQASSSNGFQNVFISEVRLWTRALPSSQISANRFHQQDASIQPLAAYYKFLSGASDLSGYLTEIDYSDANFQTRVTSSQGALWFSQSDIVFCPLWLFKGEKQVEQQVENVCYRDAITKLTLSVVRDNHGSFVITPLYSQFRNKLARSQFTTQYYNFQWSISTISAPKGSNSGAIMQGVLNPQASNFSLSFNANVLTESASRFTVSVSIQDELNIQSTYQASVSFKPLPCASIVDAKTQQSIVYLDIPQSIGESNYMFFYSYSDCLNFTFSKSKMTFSISIPGITLSSGDHNQTAQSFTLRSINQGTIPLNDYFYLTMTGYWTDNTNSQDFAGLNLVYACRFVQKMKLNLIPSTYTVLFGDTLTIRTSSSLVNYNSKNLQYQYQVKWNCPGDLNTFCQSQYTQVLQIPYSQFVASGLSPWQEWTITATAITNFEQGDGLRYSNSSISITWLDINSQAQLSTPGQSNFTRNQNTIIQVSSNGIPDTQTQIKWIVTPSINTIACFLNGDNYKQLIISKEPSCLRSGITYNVSASITYVPREYLIWQGSINLQIPSVPFGGNLVCNPSQGVAYETTVSCNAPNWKVYAGQPRYQFIAVNSLNQTIELTSAQSNQSFIGTLPPASQVFVKVIDQLEQSVNQSVTVSTDFKKNSSELQQMFNTRIYLASLQVKSPNQVVSVTADVLKISSILASQGGNSTFVDSATQSITSFLRQLAQNYSAQLNQDDQLFLASAQVQVGALIMKLNISQYSQQLVVYRNIQDGLKASVSSFIMSQIIQNNPNLATQILILEGSILNKANSHQRQLQSGIIQAATSLTTADQENLGNITMTARALLVAAEQIISVRLGENQAFTMGTSSYNMSIVKYSNLAQRPFSATYSSQATGFRYSFPLQQAQKVTDRQSLSIISFSSNPFEGQVFLNQTPSSVNTVYFAYRDTIGNYLSSSSVPGRLNISFPFKYSPFIFLPNVSMCAYISPGDTQWDNTSCITSYNRGAGVIDCSCQHMSFYSIVENSLAPIVPYPLIQLIFKNGVAFFAILYVVVILIIGTIYSYNVDLQDFRYLHEQDELLGFEAETDEQVGLLSLAFKRKVFFMDFSEQFSFSGLFRIYMMLLHPIFQIKYCMDPQVPRFYRFLLTFSRINVTFGLAFFILRYQTSGGALAAFILLISFLYVPLPSTVFNMVRSQYQLLKPRDKERTDQDSEYDDIEERLSDVWVDTAIPIKLLFLLNAMKLEKIIKESKDTSFWSGDAGAVGSKLLELDPDRQKEDQQQQVTEKPLVDLPTTRRDMAADIREENMVEDDNEGQLKQIHEEESGKRRRHQYEGGEPITLTNGPGPQTAQQASSDTSLRVQNNPELTESSIDTNLFLDEKKELIEFTNLYTRLAFGFLAFALNAGILVAVIAIFIKEGYYNYDNLYVWVVSFFGAQIVGLFVVTPLALLLLALCVTKWSKDKKQSLARFFRDALYIYEDYQFVVKFAKTKIS